LIFQSLSGELFGNSRNRGGAKSRERSMQFAMGLASRIFIPDWVFAGFNETILSAAQVSISALFLEQSAAA
jgi:hypothetical protein